MAEKYLAYPEYKGSDVGWLKQVPKHWKKITFKYLLEMMVDNRGRTPPTYDVGIPLLEAKQIDGSLKYTGTSFDKFINEAGHSGFIRDDVKENDILFITVGTIGKTCLVPNQPDFVIAQNLVALRMIDNYSPVFMLYWLRSMAARESMLATNKDSILDSIKISDFIQSRLYIPELYEQTQIANFLDFETAQIDTLIEKQQTLIQLLKEKRQAVISHAVTKGLNPDAPMKDSGVEWLGDVPEHWEVMKIGWVLNYLSYGFTNPMPTSDEGPYMLTATDINFGAINFEQARTTTNDAYDNFITDKSKPEQGDLLLTKDGTLGRVAVFNSTDKTCISQSIALLRPNKKYVLSHFMAAALASSRYQKKMLFDAGGTTIKHIYISILAKMNLALPDINEQLEIISYLNREIDNFDALISKAQQAIQLMQERRTALISAAVTGKIDVRGWRASE